MVTVRWVFTSMPKFTFYTIIVLQLCCRTAAVRPTGVRSSTLRSCTLLPSEDYSPLFHIVNSTVVSGCRRFFFIPHVGSMSILLLYLKVCQPRICQFVKHAYLTAGFFEGNFW